MWSSRLLDIRTVVSGHVLSGEPLHFTLLLVLLSFKYQENEGLRIIKKFLEMGFSGKLWIGDE